MNNFDENLEKAGVILANKNSIREFLNDLTDLVEIINKVPPSLRPTNGEMGYSFFEDENRFEFYASSHKTKIRRFLFINMGESKFVIKRRIYFELSDIPDMVKVNINEKYMSIPQSEFVRKYKNKFLVRISRLEKGLEKNIMDWLVFKISIKEVIADLPLQRNSESKI